MLSDKRSIRAGLLALIMIATPFTGLAPSSAAAPTPLTTYTLDPVPGLEYVAIAPLSWCDHLKPLLDWKTDKGVPAQVFPLEYIYTSFTGRDGAEKVHNFLRDLHFNQAPSTKWLLLVMDGDWDNSTQSALDREVFTNSQQDGNINNSQNWYTTDTYYAGLESNWDENGNGIFGEYGEGDWTPDLYVGRVPVDNVDQLDLWVGRQVAYERAPPPGIWARTAILAGALMDRPNILDNPLTSADEGYDPFTDNARKVDEEVAAELPASLDIQRYYDYPQTEGGNYSTATDTLRNGTLKTALDGGASFMLLEGHGYLSNQGVAQYADPTGTASIFRSQGEDPALRFDEVLNLSNGDRLPFVYVSACYAGDFTDRDDTSFEAFLKAPAGGAIAVVAGNGENFRLENVTGQQAFGNWWLASQFFHMLFEESYAQPGKVLGDLKARYNAYYLASGPTDDQNRNYFRAERVSYNLMGDPEFQVVTASPSTLSAAPVRQPLVGEHVVQVQVQGEGGAIVGALVRAWGPSGDVHAVTNATGVATLPYFVVDEQPFNITATAQNHFPLTTTAVGAKPDHNLVFEPPSLSLPSVVRRNQTLTVSGVVAARGVASFSNVVVEFRLSNPIDGPSIAAVALPSVAPGTPRAVSAQLSVALPGDYQVFATIDPAGEQVEDATADNVAFATLRVNAPPLFLPSTALHIKEGGILPDALFLPSFATDRESGSHALDYRVTFVSDPLLVVLLANRTLSFEAMPGAAPSVQVEVEASDGLDTARGTFTVLVDRGNSPPVVAPVGSAAAHVGELFTLNLTATDPDGDLIVWADTSSLFDISTSGKISFTPTADQVGAFAVTVTAFDGRASRSATFRLTVAERERFINVHNPPIVRGWPGQEIVIDLAALTPDSQVSFATANGAVTIDNTTRTLHYTPGEGPPRTEILVLTAHKPGLPTTTVSVTVDVAAAPAGGAELAVFALAGVGAAGLVGVTLIRAHQARVRDERMFKIDDTPPKSRVEREEE